MNSKINYDEIIKMQPTINIGCLGSVTDGKSSMVNTICKIKTQKHSSEHIRNITIKLGYANAKIFKCNNCAEPDCYESFKSNINTAKCSLCNDEMKLIKHISFVDCPGHNDLLLTMLNGISVMDHSIIVVSAVEAIETKRQLKEHITAAGISNMKDYIVCLNKLDLIERSMVTQKYHEIKRYLENTPIINAPIIPTSFNRGINKKSLLKYIVENFNEPEKNLDKSPLFVVTRSFDVNKPGCLPTDLSGGILGGSLIEGIIKNNDIIEIRPGIIKKTNEGILYKPLVTKITKIKSENNILPLVIPGGLIALGTELDSYYTKNDMAVGNICGYPNKLPNVYNKIKIKFCNLENYFEESKEIIKVKDNVIINYNSTSILAQIENIKDDVILLNLVGRLICIEKDNILIISRKLKEGCKIIGRGKFIDGIEAKQIS